MSVSGTAKGNNVKYMLIIANNNDKDRLLECLRKGIGDCLYLYIDITNYSIETDDCQVWYDEVDSEIDFILMRYYESYQIFGLISNYVPQEIVDFIDEHPVKMISGRKDLIEVLSSKLDGYKTTFGKIYEVTPKVCRGAADIVELADVKDAGDIAKLIQTNDGIGAHYSLDGLTRQIADRIRTGTGRSFIIRDKGQIVAHTATYAETDDMAVISGSVVKEECRNSGIFEKLTTSIQNVLKKEGKRVYIFAFGKRVMAYHDALHIKCGEYGKMESI